MKKYYEEPSFEEVIFEAADVIMTSGGGEYKDDSNEYNDNSDKWEGDLEI